MNLKVLQWLIANRDLLMKLVAAAQSFDRTRPYIEQWDVVDKIARLIIPVLSASEVKPQEVVANDWSDWDDSEVTAFSFGAEVQAMGIDWKQLIDVILPIVIAILQALAAKP